MDKVWILDFEADAGEGDFVGYISAHRSRAGAAAKLVQRLEEIAPGYEIDLALPAGTVFDDVGVAGWDVTYSLYQIDLQD